MLPLYEENKDAPEIYLRKSRHIPPHLHQSIECIYVTTGSLALGVGQELYHMETGDFAIVFPELIHHYQAFGSETGTALYLLFSPSMYGVCLHDIWQMCPINPVISGQNLHPDIIYIMKSVTNRLHQPAAAPEAPLVYQAYLQLLLSRSLPAYHLVKKETVGSKDIIYQTVSYIAANFKEHLTLPAMAHDLGVSPYALSRVFSGTFHKNFNQYLNETRLDFACQMLLHTDHSITDICECSGFESLRTFNRVFHDRFRMSPREYRTFTAHGNDLTACRSNEL